jgi:hypothetical protein
MTFIELSTVLGNLGEFVGSVAVLATLVYLAVQVKHSRELLERNERIAMSQVYSGRTNARVSGYLTVAESSYFPDIYEKLLKSDDSQFQAQDLEQLSGSDRRRLNSMAKAQITNYDNWLFQYELGLLDESAIDEMSEDIIRQFRFWDATGNYIPTRIQRWHEQYGDL